MENQPNTENVTFRDTISTISEQGKRVWINPKKPKGRYHTARSIVSWLLLAFLFGMPFVKMNNEPVFLLNLFERKFILFGLAFGPYDFKILVLVMIALVIFIVLFTAIYGRVFCGWICPQTVFMEMVFRKVEYWIEGDAGAQRALAKAPMSASKLIKKGSKIGIFLLISFVIAHVLMAWLVGVDNVIKIVTAPPTEHMGGFIATIVFTGIFFFIFTWFREQACVIVCPYGRLQGVLLDQNSLVVAYDYKRGEPRGIHKKNDETVKGDCIDCGQCVDVCPTGIDIRNGIQLECINCTACIDACDTVMDKINKPRGLVKYASQKGISDGSHFKITPRIIIYTIVLTIIGSIAGYLIATRTDVQVELFRTPGMISQEQDNGIVSNLYNYHIINKTFKPIPVSFKLKNIKGELVEIGGEPKAEPQKVFTGRLMLKIAKSDLQKSNTPIEIAVYQNINGVDKEITVMKSSFLAKLKKK